MLADDARLAQRVSDTLLGTGLRVLRVVCRSASARQVRSLFDWRQQLVRGAPHCVRGDGDDLFHAPGARGGEAQIVAALRDYDVLVFDCDAATDSTVALDAATPQSVILQVGAQTMATAYAVFKTLARTLPACPVYLAGEAAACARVLAAARHFLPDAAKAAPLVQMDDVHLAALAARILNEACGIDRTNNNTGAQHTHA